MSRAAEKTRETAPESKRDRVRRLLITPMQEAGFRFKKGTDPDRAKRDLLRIIDSVGYMSDRGLVALRNWALRHGEGAAKQFWPSFATFIGKAEEFEKAPLEELPELLRWFKSSAGQAALEGDRLVAEYEFWIKYKHPPTQPANRRKVSKRADDWRLKAARIQDRLDRGVSPFAGDGEWLAWYKARLAYVTALVGGVR